MTAREHLRARARRKLASALDRGTGVRLHRAEVEALDADDWLVLWARGAEVLPPERQGELLAPRHRSLQPGRLRARSRNGERVYAAAWLRLNRRRGWHGRTFLELLLRPDYEGRPWLVSARDAAVAASVVQWLGTPVGLGFIDSCERAVDALPWTRGERASLRRLQERRERAVEPRRGIRLREKGL